MLNPAVLIAMALVGLLAITIYLSASDKSNKNIELSQEKIRLEAMKFDQDFEDFKNGKEVERPNEEEIQAQRNRIKQLEEQKRIADLEDAKRRAEIQTTLDQIAKNAEEK